VCEDLSEHSRAEAARALRAVATVATAMARSLEEGRGDAAPDSTGNYGIQR
jgi:hypothetical protein